MQGLQREDQVLGCGGTAARGFLECGVAAVERVLRLLAIEDLLDGEDLEFGIGGAIGGFVDACFGGFADHWFGWFLK